MNVKSWFCSQVYIAAIFNFPWWYPIHLDNLLIKSFGFSQICNFLCSAFFSYVSFHVVFVVVSKIKLIPHTWLFIAVTMNDLKGNMRMCPDHLENWLHFGHRLLIFLILATFWLCELWAFFKQKRNDIKFGILTCPDYLQNRLELGHGFFLYFGAIWT